MKQRRLWRGLMILGVAGLAALIAFPLDEKINLGLDLQGGIHLVLGVETDDALRSETDQDLERLVRELREGGATAAAGKRLGDSSFEVGGVAADRDEAVREAVRDFLGEEFWSWRRDGARLVFEMSARNLSQIRDQAVRQALETIRNRIDAFGVAEPSIQRQQEDRIVVQLPGVDDPERIKRLIKNTAFLEFRLVDYPLG
ncbi:MAG: protein translocase subunit SecD, partial [Thermoanaerobaculia bacterium]